MRKVLGRRQWNSELGMRNSKELGDAHKIISFFLRLGRVLRTGIDILIELNQDTVVT